MGDNAERQELGRRARLKLSLGFAWRLGDSLKERARLFYHSGIKPGLVFRGYRAYAPERILRFSVWAGRGRRFEVHVRDNGMDAGTFEEFFSARYNVLPPELPPMEPRVIYDIGANIGIASLYFAARYPGARFYGFEPLPLNYEVCQLNYRNLDGSEVFPWAVGAESGRTSFEFSEQDPRGGRIGAQGGASQGRIEVEVRTMAELLGKLEAPDFVKIDVEGAELEVLRGLGQEGRRVKRMLVETHGEELEVGCLKWMSDNGFTVRHLHEAAPGYAAIWCDRVES